jgi:hypothetical protein
MKYFKRGFIMSAKEYVTGLWGKVKPAIAYITGSILLILCTAWFTGSAASKSVECMIDERIDSRINARIADEVVPMLREINDKLDLSLDVQYTEQVRQIKKTVEALKKDPGDVKVENVKVIMERWNSLPEKYKNDEIKVQYEAIRKWYEGTVG